MHVPVGTSPDHGSWVPLQRNRCVRLSVGSFCGSRDLAEFPDSMKPSRHAQVGACTARVRCDCACNSHVTIQSKHTGCTHGIRSPGSFQQWLRTGSPVLGDVESPLLSDWTQLCHASLIRLWLRADWALHVCSGTKLLRHMQLANASVAWFARCRFPA